MSYIVLTATDIKNSYGATKTLIHKHQYDKCKIFIRYEHIPIVQLKPETITVYKYYSPGSVRKSTLKNNGSYSKAILDRAFVYFNKYDVSHTNPLILVLLFKNSSNFKSRYYLRSDFEENINNSRIRNIDSLKPFEDSDVESQLLELLFEENDKLTNLLTYRIDKRDLGNYNCDKIKIDKELVQPTSGFFKFIHKPLGSFGGKKSCVLYNNQVLLWWNDKERPKQMKEIKRIQNIIIQSISVYYSTNVKEPLMIYLDKINNNKEESEYYFQKIFKKLYWQLLDRESFNYLLNIWSENDKIKEKLIDKNNKLLIKLLKKIESILIKTVMIIVDKKYEYSQLDAINYLKKSKVNTDYCRFANDHDNITVRDISNSFGNLSSKGYTVYEHDFTNIYNSIKPNETFIIKFILSDLEYIIERNDLIINLDHQLEAVRYYSQSRTIQLINFHNLKHRFVWYKHVSDYQITEGTFKVHFNGQLLTMVGNLGNVSYNNSIIVYFSYDYRDTFILIAFSDKEYKNIWYLTYSEFRTNILSGKTIKLSDLNQIDANADLPFEIDEQGYRISELLLVELKKEYEKLKSDTFNSIDYLYHQKDYNKVCIYLYGDYLRAIMICYNNKAYKRYYLGQKNSRWEPIDRISRCICSHEDVDNVETLNEVIKLLSLPDNKNLTEGQDKSFTIDISRTGPSNYRHGHINVSEKQFCSLSDLFFYYTHSHNEKTTFKISQIIANTLIKTLNLTEDITVKSITVYFNKFFPDKPVILCIKIDNGEEKYYKNIIQNQAEYTISQDNDISSRNLIDILIQENDKINNTLTYHIDKTFDDISFKYGYNNNITVSKEKKNGFTIYTHKSSNIRPNNGFILYKRNLLAFKSKNEIESINNIHNINYSQVKVYFLDIEKDFPLLIELNYSKLITFYWHKIYETKLYWEKVSVDLKNDETIKLKLYELYYFMKSSAIIEISKGGGSQSSKGTKYPIKIIENKVDELGESILKNYNQGKLIQPIKYITVSPSSRIIDKISMNYSSYNYISHLIDESITSIDNKDIVGLRLFITLAHNILPKEINLYVSRNDSVRLNDKVFLYYPPLTISKKIYVYFYGQDPRPILFCYDSKIYKRLNNEDDTKWILYKSITSCSNDTGILQILKDIHLKMEKKIIFVKTENEKNISKSTVQNFGTFKKNIYTPKFDLNNKDDQCMLSKETLVGKKSTNHANIDKLLDILYDKTFEGVNIYKINNSSDLSNILLFEFFNGTHRKHIVRKDQDAKYWSDELIEYSNDLELQTKLSSIKNSLGNTIVYEIDKQNINYNNYVHLKNEQNKPSQNFNKYTHKPLNPNSVKKNFVLYNGQRMVEKKRDGNFEPIIEINQTSYDCVNIYFGKYTNSDPLIAEFIKSNNKTYYGHKKHNNLSYWLKIDSSSIDQEKKLIYQLKKYEFDLVESIIILMDKKMDSYGDIQINQAIQYFEYTDIITAKMGSNNIKVSRGAATEAKCISDYGFKLFEHDLSFYLKNHNNCGMRFFILYSNSEKYIEIELYNTDGGLDTLYYNKSGQYRTDKVYIYFYEEDPRPLLLFCNGSAYGPKIKSEYFQKWHKISDISRCHFIQSDDNQELLRKLSEIAKFLNPIKLEERPTIMTENNPNTDGKSGENKLYEVQKYNNQSIQVKVTYSNKTCYRVYTHEPNGIRNNSIGYRLGNIKYEINNSLNYSSHKPLKSVSLYYSVYDKDHSHPLLVVLKFEKDSTTYTHEYYELSNKDEKSWVKIDHNIKMDKVENEAYKIWKKLDINYDKTTYLFSPDKCSEDNIDLSTAIGGGVGGIAGAGGIVGLGTFIYKKFIAVAVSTTA